MKLKNKNQFKRIDSILKKTDGMVTVEVILSFTVFILVVAGIIYFTNIFIIHNKVQFALNSAAHEIATYTYLYQAFGVRDAKKTIQGDLDSYSDNVDDTVGQVADTVNEISKLYNNSNKLVTDFKTVELDTDYITQLEKDVSTINENAGSAVGSGKASVEKIQGLFNDPSGTVVGIIYMAVDGGSYYVKSLGATLAAQAMCEKYLRQGDLSADQFLKNYGVEKGYEGLDFSGSTMFCDEDYRMIDLVVEYDVHMGFLGLVLPNPKVHMVQRVSVSAWLGDNGVSPYSEYLKGIKYEGGGSKKESE